MYGILNSDLNCLKKSLGHLTFSWTTGTSRDPIFEHKFIGSNFTSKSSKLLKECPVLRVGSISLHDLDGFRRTGVPGCIVMHRKDIWVSADRKFTVHH